MRIVPFLEVCCSAVFLVLLLLQVSAVFLVFSWCQSLSDCLVSTA